MKIVITCSLIVEFNEARNQLGLKEETEKSEIPRIASGRGIYLVYTGIGKSNTVINLYRFLVDNNPDLVIDSGTCGSLSDDIVPMDIIVSTKSIEYYSYNYRGHSYSCRDSIIQELLPDFISRDLTIVSIEDSVITNENRSKLKESGASVVTWETSTLFNLCSKLELPFLSVRGVTDSCNENTHLDFKQNRVEVCKKIYNYIKMMCKGI